MARTQEPKRSPLTREEVRDIWKLANLAASDNRSVSAEARHSLRSILVEHYPSWGAKK